MNEWAEKILVIEGDGNYAEATSYLEAHGKIRETLQGDLNRLRSAKIPVDIVYLQGYNFLKSK